MQTNQKGPEMADDIMAGLHNLADTAKAVGAVPTFIIASSAIDEIERLRNIEKLARAYAIGNWGSLDADMISASRVRNGNDPIDPEEAALMRALQ